jgi:hypothetical protein
MFEMVLAFNFLLVWGSLQEFAAAFHWCLAAQCAVRAMPVIKELPLL